LKNDGLSFVFYKKKKKVKRGLGKEIEQTRKRENEKKQVVGGLKNPLIPPPWCKRSPPPSMRQFSKSSQKINQIRSKS
jgi:hypothetical protein